MYYLKAWYRDRKLKQQAKHWLSNNNPDRIAASCLFHLNRTVRWRWYRRDTIYRYKTDVLHHFYNKGLCQSVALQEQVKDCWSCGGKGWHWTGNSCWKCGGSGIYATHLLYLFAFDVNGRRYVWHQPKGITDRSGWTVQVSELGIGEYESRTYVSASRFVKDRHVDLYLVVLREYLISVGERPRAIDLSLLESIKLQLGQVRSSYEWIIRSRVRPYWVNFLRFIEFLSTGEMPESEDDIPF